MPPTPPHPTQPYVQRSVHIRCNFKPTSTCPTPPHPTPTQPYVQRSVHIRCNFKPTSTCPTPPHPTPPNPMSNVACTSDATSNQRQHAPPHPTQPYVQRSVHIRCNFIPTSTCPHPTTPHHPNPPHPDPYQLMWVEARTDTTSHQAQLKCNQALSNQSFPSESLTWPKHASTILLWGR